MNYTLELGKILNKMNEYSMGNEHDIDHYTSVWTYARAIGEMERLDDETQFILEVAALLHDIACPLCREKYGNTRGDLQEKEGEVLAKEFLADSALTPEQIERVAYLVGHHHTLDQIDGLDYQILIEADYIQNAKENGWSKENVENFMNTVMKTESGKIAAKTILKL